MAIEITQKVKIKIPAWLVILLIVELLLIIILVISYLYFIFSSEKMEKILIKTPQEVNLEQDIAAKETELKLLKTKIDTFAQLLEKHQKTANLFSFLEKVCLPDVWFSKFDFSSEALTISGHTKDFVSLGQQILAFQAEPVVKEVKLSEISLVPKGGVDFSLSIKLSPTIFY